MLSHLIEHTPPNFVEVKNMLIHFYQVMLQTQSASLKKHYEHVWYTIGGIIWAMYETFHLHSTQCILL